MKDMGEMIERLDQKKNDATGANTVLVVVGSMRDGFKVRQQRQELHA